MDENARCLRCGECCHQPFIFFGKRADEKLWEPLIDYAKRAMGGLITFTNAEGRVLEIDSVESFKIIKEINFLEEIYDLLGKTSCPFLTMEGSLASCLIYNGTRPLECGSQFCEKAYGVNAEHEPPIFKLPEASDIPNKGMIIDYNDVKLVAIDSKRIDLSKNLIKDKGTNNTSAFQKEIRGYLSNHGNEIKRYGLRACIMDQMKAIYSKSMKIRAHKK